MKFDIEILWTTIDQQGPRYEPYVTHDSLYCNYPVLESEIEHIIAKAHPSWFIQKIKIISVT